MMLSAARADRQAVDLQEMTHREPRARVLHIASNEIFIESLLSSSTAVAAH